MTDEGLQQLMLDEGFRSKPYIDSEGILTIGYGTNLKQGISEKQAKSLMICELSIIMDYLSYQNWYANLNDVRKDVIINMIYNLGFDGFKGFKLMNRALKEGDYYRASEEMLDSKWAKQVGIRATRLARQMRTGCRD